METPADNNRIISVRSASILAVLILLVYLVMTIALRNELALRSIISDLALPVVDGLATISLFIAARSFHKGTRARFAWTMLAMAGLSFTLGDIIWAVIEVGLHQRPYPSIADLFYIACYPFATIGILSLPVRAFSSGERLKIFLDMGVVIIAACSWFLGMDHRSGNSPEQIRSDHHCHLPDPSGINPALDLLPVRAVLPLDERRRLETDIHACPGRYDFDTGRTHLSTAIHSGHVPVRQPRGYRLRIHFSLNRPGWCCQGKFQEIIRA